MLIDLALFSFPFVLFKDIRTLDSETLEMETFFVHRVHIILGQDIGSTQ
jgi:hypothetical protein